MRLAQFFEKFELFADAPNAVAKMRELVLQLAVQGRLVAQSSDVEPADALAVKISTDRAAFVQARSLARQRVFAPVAADQCPFDLPSGWLWTRLGNLCRVQAGFAFASAAFIQGESGVPMIRIRDITKDHTQVNYVGEYREEFLVDAGDYLVGMDGNFTVAKWCGPRALLNQRVSRLQWYSQHLEPSFFAIALQYRLLELQGTKAYTTVDHLSSGQIENAVVPLPPLAEQKRIVAKVDALMALCDRLEAQQQERDTRHAALARASLSRFAEAPTPANLDFLFNKSYPITPADLRKSILTLAVQGKLVPQDPNDEPVQSSFSGLMPLAPEPNDSEGIPDQWELCTYRALTSLVTSGSRGWKEFYSETGAIFVRTQNIKTDRLVLDDVAFVDLPKSAEGMRAQVLKDDILITITGANVTKAARVEAQIPEAYVSQHIALTRARWSEMSPWLHLCFVSHGSARSKLEQLAYGDKPGLNLNNIRDLILPIPPLAEQSRIVAKVDQLMALVDRLETQLSEARTKSAALLDAVIHELLNPTAEIIELASYRAAVGCYAISKMQGKRYFGRTAAMKVLYLAEAHVGVPMKLQPRRHFAGPYDEWIERFDEQADEVGWFKVTERALPGGKYKFDYHPGLALAEQTTLAARLLTPEQRREFDRLLDLFASKTTEEAEIIATLFAAWNDFLIDGHTPSDDEIIEEVRERWHESKRRFSPDLLRKWLDWLRQNDLVPKGRTPRTAHQTQLLLN